jgi:choloylglycine hydrolase
MEEAKTLFSSINIESHWQYHYIIFDSLGNSLVIEFIDGEAKFFDNVTQILTNNPGIDFHLSNLNNFANLKTYNLESITASSGNQFHGAGMYGLPGDWMSPGRFIRGYFMIKEGQEYISNSKEAINLASKIVNSVSLIKGIDLGISEISDPIYTQMQIIKDIKNNKIYLKKYDDFEWTEVSY